MSVEELRLESKQCQAVRMVGFGSYLPGEPVTNEQMEEVFSIRKEWIDIMIGNTSRYFAIDFKERTIKFNLTDICTEAAKQAIEDAGIEKSDIDLVVLSTATSDYIMPTTVNLIADRLGLSKVRTYQVQAGCSGAFQGIDIATQFLRLGTYRNALVIGGDVCNKYMDLYQDFSQLRASELINFALFGDGAGAVVLTNDARDGLEIMTIQNSFEGVGKEPGQVMNWFGSIPSNIQELSKRDIRKQFQSGNEDYKAIESMVPIMTQEVLDELLTSMDWTNEEVTHYLPPQLGWNMTKKIIDSLGLSLDSTINCVGETGNNGNAIPYLQLGKLKTNLSYGDKVVGIAIESSKWIKTGITLIYKEADCK